MALLAVALAAMLLRVFLPVGFMPARPWDVAHSGFQLVLCDGHASAEAKGLTWSAGDRSSHPHPGKKGGGQDSLCAYSSGAVDASTFQLARVFGSLRNSLADLSNDRWVDLAPGRGLLAPPPLQTGPPVSERA
jgi:hypothetical protein